MIEKICGDSSGANLTISVLIRWNYYNVQGANLIIICYTSIRGQARSQTDKRSAGL
ncbi:MAG: hypothetical protein Q8936_20650 [Bacillota bacterium]|nr:hypothetical protein [Bacillota bacterium]